MKVGQIATFAEIFHYMEHECHGVFTTAMTPPKGAKLRFYIFYAPDKNICLAALKTDWTYVDRVFKDYKGNWCHSDTELFRVCRILTQEEAMLAIALPEDSELWNPDKGYHWIARWKEEK